MKKIISLVFVLAMFTFWGLSSFAQVSDPLQIQLDHFPPADRTINSVDYINDNDNTCQEQQKAVQDAQATLDIAQKKLAICQLLR